MVGVNKLRQHLAEEKDRAQEPWVIKQFMRRCLQCWLPFGVG
jgi:hypothetical protein